MLMVLLFAYLLCVWLWYYLSRRHLIKLGSRIPGPHAYPIIGNGLLFWGKPEQVFKQVAVIIQFYTRMVAFWFGPQLNVILFDAKDVEVVLKASKTMEKSDLYYFLRPWLGDSILFSNGHKFKQNKSLIIQAFNLNNFKKYLDVINENAIELRNKLASEQGKEFDLLPYLTSCTIETFLETSLGVGKNTIGEQASIFAKAINKLGRLAHIRIYKFWLHPDVVFHFSDVKREQDKYIKIVHDMTDRIIQERKKEIQKRNEEAIETGVVDQRKVFLDNLLEATNEKGEKAISDQDIKDEVNTMMFAGQDTTTVSLGFALSLLGIYQECQDKVVNELDQIFGTSSRPVSYDDIISLRYLEQVIQETWRLYPPIPLIGKKSTEDVHLDNVILPKGCTVGIVIMKLHRNPLYYQHPNRFNPDNFLPDNIKARHPYSYIPFSAGYRTCVGPKYAMLVIKVILATILRKYRVISNVKEKEFHLAADTTLKKREGFIVSLEPRIKRGSL